MTFAFPRAVVTGGRRFTDYDRIEADFRALRRHGLRRVAEGASHGGGADDLAYDAWHLLVNESTERYQVKPVDGRHRGAPMNRNVRMVEAELRLAVAAGERLHGLAYPDAGSRGTWHCTAEMLRRGVPVVVWVPDSAPRPNIAWHWISAGLAMYGLPDPLVFDWGTARGVVAPVGITPADEPAFASFALQVREALGE